MNLFSKGNQPKHAQQMRLGLRSYYSLRADWDAQQQQVWRALSPILKAHVNSSEEVWLGPCIFALQPFHSYLVLSTIALCTQHFGALCLAFPMWLG